MKRLRIRAQQTVTYNQVVSVSAAEYAAIKAALQNDDRKAIAAFAETWLDLSNIDDGHPIDADDVEVEKVKGGAL